MAFNEEVYLFQIKNGHIPGSYEFRSGDGVNAFGCAYCTHCFLDLSCAFGFVGELGNLFNVGQNISGAFILDVESIYGLRKNYKDCRKECYFFYR